MMEGLWIVEYEGLQGNGAGVAVFVNGRVLGGDMGYTYEGSYKIRDSAITANVQVRNFLPNTPSVLGFVGDFDVHLLAPMTEGRVIQGTMSVVGHPGMSIALRLTKKADL